MTLQRKTRDGLDPKQGYCVGLNYTAGILGVPNLRFHNLDEDLASTGE